MEFASIIWDPHMATNIHNLEMVQRRAARFVTGDFHRTSRVTTMLQQLQWPTLQERRSADRAIMGSGGHTNLLPYTNWDYSERPQQKILDPICQIWYIQTFLLPSDQQAVEQFTKMCNWVQFRQHLQERTAQCPISVTTIWMIFYVYSAIMVLKMHLYIDGSLAPRISATVRNYTRWWSELYGKKNCSQGMCVFGTL